MTAHHEHRTVRDHTGDPVRYQDVELPPDGFGDDATGELVDAFHASVAEVETIHEDSIIRCPMCSLQMLAGDLCECDHDDTGPLCDRCCSAYHRVGSWPVRDDTPTDHPKDAA